MAAAGATQQIHINGNGVNHQLNDDDDPFTDIDQAVQQPYLHRFSSRFEADSAELGAASSPSQIKRILEAHLLDTERRLQDTHKLGTSLLQQQSELQEKLDEVQQQEDDAEISLELKQRLASIGREHDDVSREIARSLLAPRTRAVSGEEQHPIENGTTLISHATSSPTKISAPNRRSRNQPTNPAGDLQFAADISTSLLAQVRQLQTAVAERDEALKSANADRSRMEQDLQVFTQRLRSHDEYAQKYKDETWNLESQNHQLLSAQREAVDREKRLNSALSIANAEKTRLLSEVEDAKSAHSKVNDEHEASKKAHKTEIHSLKRDFDTADSDRSMMQVRIDELTAQNQELAKAMSSHYRSQSPQKQPEFGDEDGDFSRNLSTPEHSPPPSPTKGTPRHGGLESETFKSSLHHAHKMIQNLKSNIHREKTEKIELKRMLQDARDELEQRRNETGLANGSKKQKPKNEVFKKPFRPDMLGGSRRARTDVELQDDGWEDQAFEATGHRSVGERQQHGRGLTDFSDAYQTAHETESNFETADESHTTESEAFETGAESLAGDSTDELTETESTAPRSLQRGSGRHNRPSLGFRSAGTRDSYLSTASTSAGEEEDSMQTPIQTQHSRFKLRNGRSSGVRHTQVFDGTPDSVRSEVISQDSPATVTGGRSPPAAEQSLFAELEGIHDTSSTFSTPARSGIITAGSSPVITATPSKSMVIPGSETTTFKPVMVDSAMMTEPWQPEPDIKQIPVVSIPEPAGPHSNSVDDPQAIPQSGLIGGLPQLSRTSTELAQHVDSGTQYTPQKDTSSQGQPATRQLFEQPVPSTPSRAVQDSPVRAVNTFITPPKTVWDAEHESEVGSPDRYAGAGVEPLKPSFGYSGMLVQDSTPKSPVQPAVEAPPALAYSTILSQQTYPISPPPSQPPKGPLPALPGATKQDRFGTEKVAAGAAAGGMFAGAAAALGLSWAKDKGVDSKAMEEENRTVAQESSKATRPPLQDVSGNVTPLEKRPINGDHAKQREPLVGSGNDQGSQTTLTAQEIERALQPKPDILDIHKLVTVPAGSPMAAKPVSGTASPSPARSPDLSKKSSIVGASAPTSPPLRPSSASSHRPSTANKQHPPLPPDYKTNIARANSLVQSGSTRKESTTQAVGTVMGPPLMPASAMRRPKTPVDSTRSPTRDNATPRVIHSSRQRAGTESQLSRRSSVSSFASELDERFNIRAGAAGGYEPAPGTDPRMIQAITQTMIGEYLWKYTRKTGSREMSNTRHKRYFWVHPYTKTLYWSSTDPSLPGAKEGTSRSVPIESVRVVTDDNPMPPGLHRKSLEITTPSRKVKFTAATGQRHETWFNALSYLLLRGEPPDVHGAYSTGGNEITRDDINEFRANGYDPHLIPTSRQSMSSYNSRTTAGTSKRVSGAVGGSLRQSLPSNVVSDNNGTLRHQESISRNSSRQHADTVAGVSRADSSRESDRNRTIRASSVSRVSRMLGSITGRTSSRQAIHEEAESQAEHSRGPSRQSNSIYDASVVSATRDSAEETRQEMLRQEPAGHRSSGGLENVRACCDGKHDVSTLHHTHRPSERQGALSSMSDRINRSMSKRI